jgi:hypothetical protein
MNVFERILNCLPLRLSSLEKFVRNFIPVLRKLCKVVNEFEIKRNVYFLQREQRTIGILLLFVGKMLSIVVPEEEKNQLLSKLK